MTYRALVVDKSDDDFSLSVVDQDESQLPDGDVTIAVEWSSLNYKDALACVPDGRIIRSYPMVPGVDLAGRVLDSSDPRFSQGDAVLATGYDIGVSHPGGYAQRARLPADWVVALPPGLTAQEAMALGTAGFTSALSIHALEQNGLTPDSGTVIVTGATGGVGSTAVAMLAKLGYTVAASTGKDSEHDYLRALGASEILSREDVSGESKRPIESERWAGAIDPVGGNTTAYLLRTMKHGASVAVSGLTGGMAFSTTVLPFILRGVNLLGIDSVLCPAPLRELTWQRIASELKPDQLLDTIAVRTELDAIPDLAQQILQGKVRGRALVQLG